jgi:RNA polymerase sigma-70 factor (ECF subfamily)
VDEQVRAQLVARASAGDAGALQPLLMHYHPVLTRFIQRRIAARLRRHVDPEDVLQQAYVTAFKSIADAAFEGPSGFYKWLEQIALARLHDAARDLRRKKRDIRRDLHDDSARGRGAARVRGGGAGGGAGRWQSSWPGLLAQLSGGGSTPSRKLARQEASAALMSSLARLTDEQRTVITMRFLEGRPAAEIAAQLGKTEQAVYALCHRGLTALREQLNDAAL